VTTARKPRVRRDFDLPEEDEQDLEARELEWETVVLTEGGAQSHWLFIRNFPLPPGYSSSYASAIGAAIIGIRVSGYPGAALDMVYIHPALRRTDGRAIPNVGDITLDGKPFQQWSRHYTPANPFRVGIDGLTTHLRLVEEWLLREFRR
jgi:hypothetical protein